MRRRKLLFIAFFILFIFSKALAFEFKKNESAIYLSAANDKLSYGISQNKDDQLTASAELHLIFPYIFFDLEDNSITNRGSKSNPLDPSTFTSGRYDELMIKAGTEVNLFKEASFSIDIIPQAGFLLLGNFGMETAQNLNHKSNNIDTVNLEYEKFEKPFAPLINFQLTFSYAFSDFIKAAFDFSSSNAFFYSTEQRLSLSASFGSKSQFTFFAGYSWDQLHNNSTSLKLYKDNSSGFDFGFILNTGLLKFDYITWPGTSYGLGRISLDFLSFNKHNWQKSDIHFFTGLCHLLDMTFLENQIQSRPVNNFSFYLKSTYSSGFKSNRINPSQYRYERDYQIITAGVKYEYPLNFLNKWLTPYIEMGSGAAIFGLQRIANHIPASTYDFYKYKTKAFWQMQAIAGLDIIPQGLLNFSNAAFSLSFFAGTIIIPQASKASDYIRQDTYRTTDWKLKPLEFIYGFSLHMGLDF